MYPNWWNIDPLHNEENLHADTGHVRVPRRIHKSYDGFTFGHEIAAFFSVHPFADDFRRV